MIDFAIEAERHQGIPAIEAIFQACLLRVVHQNQRHSSVGRQIAGADELLVAGKIREGDGSIVDDFEKPFRTATMLDVGPSGRANARQIEAVALGDE